MSEPIWTAKPIARPQPTDFRHESVIDGLKVYINEKGDTTDWTVEGWLANVHTFGSDYNGYKRPIGEAKAQAIAAAHRLYAAGVRGEKSWPVSCCDRLLPTAEAAKAHEIDHVAEKAEAPGPVAVYGLLGTLGIAPAGAVVVHLDDYADSEHIIAAGGVAQFTDDPSAVTCPACREWVEQNAIPAEATYQADIAISEAERVIGPEEADIEHQADVVAREQATPSEAEIDAWMAGGGEGRP